MACLAGCRRPPYNTHAAQSPRPPRGLIAMGNRMATTDGTGALLGLPGGASGVAGAGLGGSSGVACLLVLVTRCVVGGGEAACGTVARAMSSGVFPVEKRGMVLAVF